MPTGTKNSVISGCGFHHISIQTPDLEKSLHLYRDILGMAVRYEFDVDVRRFALLDMGDGGYVELQTADPQKGLVAAGGPLLHFSLAVHDARAVTEKLRQAGYEITMEPKDIDMADFMPSVASFFKGPSGESVEIFQEK